MFSLHLSYRWIRWTRPTTPPPPLPDGIERNFIATPGGPLEILYAGAKSPPPAEKAIIPTTTSPPLFFVHGGMGGAWVWLDYMRHLSSHGVPCYAISLRGHGESWHPSFLRMVYGTTKRALADDLVAGVRWAEQHARGEERGGATGASSSQVVLVGHSSGGGLSQLVLSEGDVGARGLALVGAVPGSGSLGVYINWWLLDPWFSLRMLLHGWHPNSPLSHPALTRRAFFSDAVSDPYVSEFQGRLNAYESLLWPLGMMRPFTSAQDVIRRISGWGASGAAGNQRRQQRILVLAGERDRLMTLDVMTALAGWYRRAFCQLVREGTLRAEDDVVGPMAEGEGGPHPLDDAGDGVRFCVVPGAGHHMQNDAQWEAGAEKLLAFHRQL